MCTMCCAVLCSVLDAKRRFPADLYTEFQTILSQKVMSCNNKLMKNNPAVVLGRAIKL